MIITFTILIAAIAIGTYLFMQGKQFGSYLLEKIRKNSKITPHYKNGKFQTSIPLHNWQKELL
ncbi:hypothetical protein [Cloacibacterium normanense]